MNEEEAKPLANEEDFKYRTGHRRTHAEITIQPAWHRQPTESIQAYAAFCAYLMLPMEERTLNRTKDVVGKSLSLMEKWSQRFQWRVRAASYEEHYLLLNLESIQAKRDDMFLQHESLARTGVSIVEAAMTDLISKIQDGKLSAEHLKPDALNKLLDTVVKVHRQSILGRAESAEAVAEQQEKLADRYADELAELMRNVLDELNLSEEQVAVAKAAVAKHLTGAKA